ncbi:MAG: serine/threonine-protein kinase, partial [Byssovorax sp.]
MNTSVRLGDVLLGKYRVERVLGKGGMGVVVAARHLELGELFAIKLLLPSTVADPEVIERFIREARAAARLRSEHVARVHDVGRLESGAPYMIMEHLDGSDLRSLVRGNGPLPIDDAVTYVLQACEAIAEAHGVGIIHRDIKPANLFLIRRPNGSASVKVLDFGISKQTGVEEVELTTTGAMLGSPMYMSPEQIMRSKSADSRSDIWALGVVLYELVTGRGPFKAATVVELIAFVLQEDPEPPGQLRPDLPPAIESVILRCLRKQPGERFQSIGELAAALSEARPLLLSAPPRAVSLPSLSPSNEPSAVQAQTAAMTLTPSPSTGSRSFSPLRA